MIRKTSSSKEILMNKLKEVILRSGIKDYCYYNFDKSFELTYIGLMPALPGTDIPKINSHDYEKLKELGLKMNFYILIDNCKIIELRIY